MLVGSLALSTKGLSRLLGTGPMVHGGRISFALYLVHVPVFEIFWTFMGWSTRIAPGSGLGTFLIPHVFLATLVLAHLVFRYVEEPARRALRRREPGRRARNRVAGGPPVPEEGAPAAVRTGRLVVAEPVGLR